MSSRRFFFPLNLLHFQSFEKVGIVEKYIADQFVILSGPAKPREEPVSVQRSLADRQGKVLLALQAQRSGG